jgi:hypothetical protein
VGGEENVVRKVVRQGPSWWADGWATSLRKAKWTMTINKVNDCSNNGNKFPFTRPVWYKTWPCAFISYCLSTKRPNVLLVSGHDSQCGVRIVEDHAGSQFIWIGLVSPQADAGTFSRPAGPVRPLFSSFPTQLPPAEHNPVKSSCWHCIPLTDSQVAG